MSVEGSVGEVKLRACLQSSVVWDRPFGPRSFTSPISTMMPPQFLRTQLRGVPQKCFQSGPALAKAGPVVASHSHTHHMNWSTWNLPQRYGPLLNIIAVVLAPWVCSLLAQYECARVLSSICVNSV